MRKLKEGEIMAGTPVQKCIQALQSKMAIFGKVISIKEATAKCNKKFAQGMSKTINPKPRNFKTGL